MIKYEINDELMERYDGYTGATFDTIRYGELKVLGIYDKSEKCGNLRYVVEFIESGFQTVAYANRIRSGEIKDYTKSVCGVGSLEGFTFEDEPSKNKYYDRWSGMIQRCYDEDYKNYRPEGTVSDRWLKFINFLDDIEKIPGYLEMIEYPDLRWDIDKDLMIYGNQIYSLDTCCFIPDEINRYIAKYKHENKEYKFIGVEPSGTLKFRSAVCLYKQNRKRYCVPTSEDKYEVHEGYWDKKMEEVEKVLNIHFPFLCDQIKDAVHKRFQVRREFSLSELKRADAEGHFNEPKWTTKRVYNR